MALTSLGLLYIGISLSNAFARNDLIVFITKVQRYNEEYR